MVAYGQLVRSMSQQYLAHVLAIILQPGEVCFFFFQYTSTRRMPQLFRTCDRKTLDLSYY